MFCYHYQEFLCSFCFSSCQNILQFGVQGRPLFTLMVQLAFTGKMLINSRMFALILLFTDLVSEAIKRVQNSGGISHWLTADPEAGV